MQYPITKALPERFHIAVSVNVLLKQNDTYFLLRRANTGWADGYFGLPAGHLDGNESLTAAACREAKEEIGVDLRPTDLTLVHVMHRSDKHDDQERLDFYFLTTSWRGDPHIAEPHKADQLSWFSTSNLPTNTLENVRKVLLHYQGQLLSEIHWS